ncbi:hypothetical protein NR798_31160 [Archangium gephyra]|uniref:hypothetical protein n=1 Tax=Archangium gephyra TaxID=48 RepID=UPI0035D4B5AA
MRANINRFQESRYRDNDGEPIICSEFALLPPELLHRERVLSLLELAVSDAAREIDPAEQARMPLIVGTPAPERPGGVSELFPEVLVRLQREHALRFETALSRCIPTGNSAGLHALAEARTLMERHPQIPGCYVAGVDSLVNAPALWWFDRRGSLKRPGNSDGVIPGEAAACIRVTRRPPPGRPGPMAILGLGFARETALPQSDEPLRANGMVEASRLALAEAGLGIADIDFRLSDASGEGYGFKEISLALSRMLRTRKESVPLWLPAETLGEIGAASGIAALVVASVAMGRGYAPGTRAICYTADHSGDRAVAVLGLNSH